MTKLIYALQCPFTKNIHYIGKTEIGLTRPFSHLSKSHNQKINEWVEDLRFINNKPNIIILENVREEDNIFNRERYWINKYLNEGAILLNIDLVNPILINPLLDYKIPNSINIDEISYFIKIKRKELNLTQKRFAELAGVALTVLRKLEQGKTNINLDSLLVILKMFGTKINITRF